MKCRIMQHFIRVYTVYKDEIHLQKFLEFIACDPSIYTMDHSGFLVSSFMDNSGGPKTVKSNSDSSKHMHLLYLIWFKKNPCWVK